MADSLRAGAARAPITGTGRYGLGGPGRRAATGVHDDLFARGLAISDGMQSVVFLGIDVRGVPAGLVGTLGAEIRRRVATGRLHVLAAGTGTSSGPDLLGEGRGCGRPYAEFFIDQCATVAVRALEALEPAEFAAAAVAVPADLVVGPAPVSPVPMLALSAVASGGRPIATLAVLHCRPDVLGRHNRKVSADYLAAYHTAIEAARGGLSLALAGAVGDQTAREAGAPAALRTVAAAKVVGESLSTPVLHGLASAVSLRRPQLDVVACHADIGTAPTWRGRRAWLGSLIAGSRGRVRADAYGVQIGACQFLTVPGAPTLAACAQVHEQADLPFHAVVGCVNGMWGLLAPPNLAHREADAVWPQTLSGAGWPIIRGMLPVL